MKSFAVKIHVSKTSMSLGRWIFSLFSSSYNTLTSFLCFVSVTFFFFFATLVPRTFQHRVCYKVIPLTQKPSAVWPLEAPNRVLYFCPRSLGWRHWPCANSSTPAGFLVCFSCSLDLEPGATTCSQGLFRGSLPEMPSLRKPLLTTALPFFSSLAAFVFLNGSSQGLTWYDKLIGFPSHPFSLTRVPLPCWRELALLLAHSFLPSAGGSACVLPRVGPQWIFVQFVCCFPNFLHFVHVIHGYLFHPSCSFSLF